MAQRHAPDHHKICELIGNLGFIYCQITHDNQNLGKYVNNWQATIQNLIDELNATQGPLCYYYQVKQLQKHYTYVNSDVTWGCIKKNIRQYTLDISNALWVLTLALDEKLSPRSQDHKKYLKCNPSIWFIN
jgi:hypothetical protein